MTPEGQENPDTAAMQLASICALADDLGFDVAIVNPQDESEILHALEEVRRLLV
jgi:hypothetical protein